jgi:sugar transferase (PEP-CTERM/EpsH1 system associated)
MHEAVENAMSTQHYDLVFVYCSSMAQFIPMPSQLPVVIDFVDADSAKWIQYSKSGSFLRSWFYAREGNSLARYEEKIAREFNLCFVATQQEAVDLGGGRCRSVEVVHNGVQTPPSLDSSKLPEDIRRLQPYALFVGTMSYRPNVDAVQYFVEEILPLVRQTHPAMRFVIVGRDPTPDVKKLSQVRGVVVTGSVPDVHPFLAGAAMAVAPFRIAQGVQNKVLEALASGVPIVLTSKPARGISDPAKQFLLVADTPADFAATMRSVLEDPQIRQKSLAAAPDLQKSLSWEPTLSRMECLLLELASIPQESSSGFVS